MFTEKQVSSLCVSLFHLISVFGMQVFCISGLENTKLVGKLALGIAECFVPCAACVRTEMEELMVSDEITVFLVVSLIWRKEVKTQI